MSADPSRCSFCGVEQSPTTPLIAGQDGFICEACIQCAHRVVSAWGNRGAVASSRRSCPSPRELKAQLDEYVVGQEEAKKVLSIAVFNHYQRLSALENRLSIVGGGVELEKSNILLFGPTGSGKTLLAKRLAQIAGVPFAVADATTLTQAGYVGEDVDTIIHRLLDSAGGDVKRAEWGIVYIDEIDKISRRSQGSTGVRDISGEGVQQALLKLVEGHQVTLPKQKNKEREGNDTIDTTNILFIAGGAFAGLLEDVQRRLSPARSMGFAERSSADEELDVQNCLEHVENADFRQYGFIPEFLGRFPVLAGLEALDADALVTILTEPKNALTRQYQVLFGQSRVALEFSPEALKKVAQKAIDNDTGARGLRAVLEEILRPAMFELPAEEPKRLSLELDEDEFALRSSPMEPTTKSRVATG